MWVFLLSLFHSLSCGALLTRLQSATAVCTFSQAQDGEQSGLGLKLHLFTAVPFSFSSPLFVITANNRCPVIH